MKWLVVAFVACILVVGVYSADESVEWCYHDPSCNDTTWPTIVPKFCNGSRQSPINIVSADATADANLTNFTFTQFDNTSALAEIINTGKTVKVNLRSGVRISGGGLPEPYDSLQFHLHWGNGSSTRGSEHTVNGKSYPMEMHIVNVKSSHNLNTTLAVNDSTGLAALGFFLEVDTSLPSNQPSSWRTLTSYLNNITLSGNVSSITNEISLDDLLTGVNRSKYYRYLGSLTTPSCNEAVVWTVFKEPIKISSNLVDLFSTILHINTTDASPLMVNVFRNVQESQPVTTQAREETSDSPKACASLGLLALSLVLGKS
ncbi:carbonic anhydrase 4-like [Dunckerocampus dactyliophorus]|uniref:carbonic anhydrase 4-like n=1 Tax=Dunckerocampus dactyliophorus TaxID=161453 RepID=UPI0024065EB4|nr:carbonic anhydrase 4-like [Dunckerocampus dactyliophorus]